MGDPTYSLEVDLDGDGVFEVGDDVLGDARADAPPHFRRGLDSARIISPPSAGIAGAVVDNRSGAYGPGSGLVKGRSIRLLETGGYDGTPRRLWGGILDDPVRHRTRYGDAFVALSGFGNLSRLVGKPVATRLYENIRTDEALDALCDAAGYPKNLVPYILQDVAQPPALYWILNDAAGSGTVEDASGNGRDGTAGADVTLGHDDGLDDEGRTNARSSNTADSIITLPSGNGMPTGSAARSFLLRVRFGWTSGPANTAIFGYGVHAANEAFNLQRTGAFGDNSLYLWAFSNDVVIDLPAGANMSDGEEHTLILTVDDDGQTVRVYYDGVEGPSPETFGVPINTGDGDLTLGQTTGAGAFAYLDRWAHFAVWNGYALTASEAAAIHSRIITARRRFQEGRTTLLQWWLGNNRGPEDAFAAALVLLNTEGPGARLYEDRTGAIVFRNRNAIVLDPRSTTVQAAFTDSGQPSPSDAGLGDSRGEVFNDAQITTVRREAQALGVVWEFGDTLTLAAGQTRVVNATVGSTVAGSTDATDPVKNAETPTEGDGDFVVASGSVTSVTLDRDSGGIIPIRITAGPDGAEITGLRLRAERLAITATTIVPSRSEFVPDDESERKPWDRPIRPEIDPDDAQSMADVIPGWYRDGRPVGHVEVRGDNATKLGAQLDLEVSDRVSLTDAFLDLSATEFYVLSLRHRLEGGAALLVTELGIEQALGNVYGVWDSDASLWDVALWGW